MYVLAYSVSTYTYKYVCSRIWSISVGIALLTNTNLSQSVSFGSHLLVPLSDKHHHGNYIMYIAQLYNVTIQSSVKCSLVGQHHNTMPLGKLDGQAFYHNIHV